MSDEIRKVIEEAFLDWCFEDDPHEGAKFIIGAIREAGYEIVPTEVRKALEFYADRSGRGRIYVVVKRGETEPIETIHDMGYRARTALEKT